MRRAPALIRLLSCLLVVMGLLGIGALAEAWLSPTRSSEATIALVIVKADFAKQPILFSVLAMFVVFSGITGFGILKRHSRAYDVGIVWCLAGLVLFTTLTLLEIGLIDSQEASMVKELAVFGGLLAYFVSHRTEWRKGTCPASVNLPHGPH